MTWGALALTLTLAGGAWTWWAFRHRGMASGTRGVALTLLPVAAYLTGTLELAARISSSVTRWATMLVFSPMVWLGVVLAGLSVVLFMVSGLMSDRRDRSETSGPDALPGDEGRGSRRSRRSRGRLEASEGRGEPAIDDDLADIEAILRKRGIQ